MKFPYALYAAAAVVAWAQDPEQFFDERVEPILRSRCLACHNQQLAAGGVSFTDRDSLLKAGRRGAAIVPGKPDESVLIQAVRQKGDIKMPPGAQLSPREIAGLAEWIARGARWGTKQLRSSPAAIAAQSRFEIWTFDRIDEIGGNPATIVGHPRVIQTPLGKAVEFDGRQDALFIDVHPLDSAATFTWEVIFRPDADGPPAQRFFHLQENGTENRLLLEIRIVDGRWCLDGFAKSSTGSRTLINRERLHALGAWYHVAMVYDGRELRNYVDGVLEGAAEVALAPQGAGRSSIGTRIDRRDYFKGGIRQARMTHAALPPQEFLRWKP